MLRVEQLDGITFLRILADVDIATAPHLVAALAGLADESVVVIDFEHCPYFDSSGFAALYRAMREHYIIVRMSKDCPIRRLFDIVDGAKIFPIYADDATALEAARRITRTNHGQATDTVP